jgi:hypothetical protein
MAPSSLSPQLVRALAWQLHFAGKEMVVDWANVQRQRGCSDCGAFAIAFAVELCFGFDPSNRVYSQQDLRLGISECFKKQIMSPLSSKETKGGLNMLKEAERIKLFCICRQPWYKSDDEEMAECSVCREWYHRSHDNIADDVFEGSSQQLYVCSKCLKKS